MKDLDYIILGTFMKPCWEHFSTKQIFGCTFPFLFLLDIMVFIEIRRFAYRRKELNITQQKNIGAVKMFVPVVIVLFLCNTEPYAQFYYTSVENFVYREPFLGIFLPVAINSAVNLLIYYFKGSSFRNEVKALLSSCICWAFCKRR